MTRFLSFLIATSFVACAQPESASVADTASPDSTMVVASSSRVPSRQGPVVVFLGTSLTAGLGLENDGDTYVARLAEIADSVGKSFRAINAGVSGETSAGGLRRLDWVLRNPIDVLVLELGANDGLRGQDPFALLDNLTQIVRRTRTRYPAVRIIVAGMEAPPNMGRTYTGAFRKVFADVAEAEGTELVPFLLEGVAGIPELNQADRIHPTMEGHMRVAANAWPVLERVLDQIAGGAR